MTALYCLQEQSSMEIGAGECCNWCGAVEADVEADVMLTRALQATSRSTVIPLGV